MIPEDQQQLKAYLKGAAEIFYRNTDSAALSTSTAVLVQQLS